MKNPAYLPALCDAMLNVLLKENDEMLAFSRAIRHMGTMTKEQADNANTAAIRRELIIREKVFRQTVRLAR